jgi:hypothetical protein
VERKRLLTSVFFGRSIQLFPVHRKVRKGMETEEKHDVSQYLTVLRRAKSDNEKFAALLMVKILKNAT